MAAELSIGEVARQAGLATSAIRYYEREGLLPIPRRVSGKRRYEPVVLERLAVIGFAKRAGFSLDEIKVLLQGMGGGRRATRRLATLAEKKLPEVEAAIRRLEDVRRLLQAAARCQCPTLTDCVAASKMGPG